MDDHVLVVGATGVVGYAALRHFASRGDCRVTALSRRPPIDAHGVRHVALDLLDERACAALAPELASVTRVVYAALYEKPGLVAGWLDEDQIETNERMLRNLFEPLEASARGLRHVALLQGTKAYGVHVRPLHVPAREDRDEWREHPNFYWRQEDYIRSEQAGRPWSWTILRPQIVFGLSIGAAMNLVPAIGVYAALRRERGLPLAYPGGDAPVLEAVDADLLARAIDWAGDEPGAAGQAFNVTNGDVFVWQHVWPAIADALGMEPAPSEPERLGETMPLQSEAWDAIRVRHGLRSPGLQAFVGESFHYADFCMATGATGPLPPALVSTVKLRRTGFCEAMDTEEMFRKWIRVFQDARLLPPR